MKKIVVSLVSMCLILCLWGTPSLAASFEWERSGPDNSNAFVYLSPRYQTDNTIYALSSDRLYTSVDGGNTWRVVSGSANVLAVQPALDNKLYVFAEERNRDLVIYYFDPGSRELKKVCTAPAKSQNFAVVLDKSNELWLYTSRTFMGEAGETWEVSQSSDGGAGWLNRIDDTKGVFAKNMFVHGTIQKLDAFGIYGVFPGGGSFIGNSTKDDYDQMFVSPNYREDKLVLGVRYKTRLETSVDGGRSWSPAYNGLERVEPIAGVAFSTNFASDHTLYAAEKNGNVYKSETKSISWRSLDTQLPKGATLNNLAVLPDGTMLAGASNGIYVSIPAREQDDAAREKKDETQIQEGVTPENDPREQENNGPAPPQLRPLNTYTTQFKLGASSYSVNGRDFTMDTYPYLENDRVYVPVRFLAYGLNISEDMINWDDSNKEVSLYKNNTLVKMRVDSLQLFVNGINTLMDVTPQIDQSNRVTLPARWVSEALGATVSWDETEKTVTIRFEDAL